MQKLSNIAQIVDTLQVETINETLTALDYLQAYLGKEDDAVDPYLALEAFGQAKVLGRMVASVSTVNMCYVRIALIDRIENNADVYSDKARDQVQRVIATLTYKRDNNL